MKEITIQYVTRLHHNETVQLSDEEYNTLKENSPDDEKNGFLLLEKKYCSCRNDYIEESFKINEDEYSY